MEAFAVAASQGHSADVLGVKRLPADRELGPLRVELGACRWLRRSQEGWNSRSVLAVPLLALGNIELQAVGAGEIPSRTGDRNAHFLVHTPDVPVIFKALSIHRADR